MGLKMKNVNIMWLHQFLGGEEGGRRGMGHKKQYIWGTAKKRGLRQFAGGLAKNREERGFKGKGGGGGGGGLIPRCTL